MTDPRNNNPFTTDTRRDTRSEYDANRELRNALTNIANALDPAETEIDFDEREYLDGGWWSEQDAEMRQQELDEIESLAEIQEYRTQGYM